MFNKIYLILSIFCFISCFEKPKPFTYDYVEIGSGGGLGLNFQIKIDSSKTFFIRKPNDSIIKGMLPDSLQNLVDFIASNIFYDSLNKINNSGFSECECCNQYYFFLKKGKFIKVIRNNPLVGDVRLFEEINRIRRNSKTNYFDSTFKYFEIYYLPPSILNNK